MDSLYDVKNPMDLYKIRNKILSNLQAINHLGIIVIVLTCSVNIGIKG